MLRDPSMNPRLLVAAALVLAGAATLLPPAAAQQSGAVTIMLDPASHALGPDQTITIAGTVTLTMDATVYASAPNGVPVTYTVLQAPAWASVMITPSSDVFPLPMVPYSGAAVTVSRPVTITVSVGDGPADSVAELVSMEALTTAGFLGQSFAGRGETAVSFIAPEPEEDCDALTAEQRAALVEQAAAAYADYEEAQSQGADEVTTQSTGATPIGGGWIAVAAFGLVGAGVGLLLKRRLSP